MIKPNMKLGQFLCTDMVDHGHKYTISVLSCELTITVLQ